MHGDWVPDAVLAEEGDGVTFLEAISLHESGAEVGGSFFDLGPIQTLFGDGICVACELVWWEAG